MKSSLIVCAVGALMGFVGVLILAMIDIQNNTHEHGVLMSVLCIFGWMFAYVGNQISKLK